MFIFIRVFSVWQHTALNPVAPIPLARGMFTRGLRLMTRSPHLRPLAVLRPLPVRAFLKPPWTRGGGPAQQVDVSPPAALPPAYGTPPTPIGLNLKRRF